MNILDKNQLEDKLGKFGIWSGKAGNAIIGEVKYLGGIPEIDQLAISPISTVSMVMRPKGVEINFMLGLTKTRIGLFHEKLSFWTVERQEEVVAKQSKSVIGRALIGGILLGPLGAIVGGITGIGDKTVKLYDVDNIVSISYSQDNQNYMILFSCTNNKMKKVYSFLSKNLGAKYQKPESIKFAEENNTNSDFNSVADELKKLKSLLDDGILNANEFDDQKMKLLNK